MSRRRPRRLALVCLGLALAIAPLPAQHVAPSAASRDGATPLAATPPARGITRSRLTAVRAGKWALLGAAVGFGVYAVRHTARAQEQYDALIAACTTTPRRCDLDGGRYPDEGIERLYQRTLEQDRRARIGIVGGQASLLGSLALFIYDLRNGRGPADIPYPGDGAARSGSPGVVAGLRLAF